MQISQQSTCVGVFFNKVADPQNSNFIKKRLQHRFFLVKFAKFCFANHLQRLLLTVSGFQPATLLKERLRERCFSVNFPKFLRTSFDRTPLDDCFLCLSVNLRSFSEYLVYRAPLGNCLFHVQAAEFQPPDTVKSYFTSALQAFYTRTRSSQSNAFIYLKSLKIICEEVIICNEVVRCQPASLRKKLFHKSSFMYFAFIFSECITITFSEESLKVCEHDFFQRKVVKVIYLFNHDSSKSTFFMLNMAFDVPYFLQYKDSIII